MSTRSLEVPDGTRSAVRQLVRVALPLVAHGLVTVLATMNDTILLGRQSPATLASAAAAGAVAMVGVMMVAGLVGTPTQILVARAFGAGDQPGAARAADRSVPLGIAAALVLGVACAVAAPMLVRTIGDNAVDADLSALMLRVALLGLPFTALSNVARAYASGRGVTGIVVRASVVAVAADVLLSWLLLPLLGPIGVTVGTAASPVASTVAYLVWLRRLRRAGDEVPDVVRAIGMLPGRAQRETFALGWSEALLGATSAGAGVVVTVLLSGYGPVVLAASRSLEALTVVCWPVLMGISSAGLTLLSHSRGAGSQLGYRRSLTASLAVSGATAAVLTVGIALAARPLVTVGVGPELAAQAAPVILLAALQTPWIVLTTTALSVCRSFRDTRTPLWASLLGEYAVFLPVGWVLCRVLDGGIVGLFVTHHVYYLAFAVIAVGSATRHLRRDWETPSAFEARATVASTS